MKYLLSLIVLFAVVMTVSCKAITTKSETKPLPIQVLGGWKMRLPGPGQDILTFEHSVDIDLKEGQRLFPKDGSVTYKFHGLTYPDLVSASLSSVFRVHKDKWEGAKTSLNTCFSFTLYLIDGGKEPKVAIKMQVEAILYKSGEELYTQKYETEQTFEYTPAKNSYPDKNTILALYGKALEAIAVNFEKDDNWRKPY